MAILTASGRAALAAAIKQQTLHLALGEGDPLWDTTKAISTPFDEAGVIELGFQHLADIRVTSLDDQTEYVLDADYSANAREGVIRRLPASTIPEGGDVTVHFKVSHPPESIGQTALLREVGRRVVDEVHFVAADPEGEIVVPTGRYRLSVDPTNHYTAAGAGGGGIGGPGGNTTQWSQTSSSNHVAISGAGGGSGGAGGHGTDSGQISINSSSTMGYGNGGPAIDGSFATPRWGEHYSAAGIDLADFSSAASAAGVVPKFYTAVPGSAGLLTVKAYSFATPRLLNCNGGGAAGVWGQSTALMGGNGGPGGGGSGGYCYTSNSPSHGGAGGFLGGGGGGGGYYANGGNGGHGGGGGGNGNYYGGQGGNGGNGGPGYVAIEW